MPNKSPKAFDVRANPSKPLTSRGLPDIGKGGASGAPNKGTPSWVSRPAAKAAKAAK